MSFTHSFYLVIFDMKFIMLEQLFEYNFDWNVFIAKQCFHVQSKNDFLLSGFYRGSGTQQLSVPVSTSCLSASV